MEVSTSSGLLFRMGCPFHGIKTNSIKEKSGRISESNVGLRIL
jgi:hypothetical protein